MAVRSRQMFMADKDGMTPLMHSAAAGDAGTVRLLLSCGCPVRSKTRQGVTALMLAAKSGCVGSAMLLVQAGADPEATDAKGRTAVFYAVQSRSEAMVQLIVDCGVRTELVDKDGKTLLAHAAEACSYSITRLLLQMSNLMQAPQAVVPQGSREAASSPQTSAAKSQPVEPLTFAQRVASASKAHLFDVEDASPTSSNSLVPPSQPVFIPPVQLSKLFVTEPTTNTASAAQPAEEDSNSSADSSPRAARPRMPVTTISHEVANDQRGAAGQSSTSGKASAPGSAPRDTSSPVPSNGSIASFSVRTNPLATPSAENRGSDDDSDDDSISVGDGVASGSSRMSSGKRKSLGGSVKSPQDEVVASIMASPMLKAEVLRLMGKSPAFQQSQHEGKQQSTLSSSFDFSTQPPALISSPKLLATPAPAPFSPGAQLWQQMLAASPGQGGLSAEDELKLLEALNAKWATPGTQAAPWSGTALKTVSMNGQQGVAGSDRMEVMALVNKMMKPHQVMTSDLSKAQFQWIANEVTNTVLKSKAIQASPNGLTPTRKDEKRVSALVDKYVEKARRRVTGSKPMAGA